MSSACLSENDVQALLAGAVETTDLGNIEAHLDACLGCQLLVSAGVRTTSLRTQAGSSKRKDQMHFEVGQVVSGRYEITRFIARGGMGEVYAAHDRMLDENIALKVLLRPASTSPTAFARLKAEVQLARRVTDPHVLRVFDLGSYRSPDGSEILFLTMELLSGETLRDRVRRTGPLRPDEIWRLADDMFAALAAAHQIGIVHRDFKSDNVMLVPSEGGRPRAVVMDFGLAQAVVTNTPFGDDGIAIIAGTLGYMAPEQLSGSTVTAAADVYAFGVVLHEMLTGVLPPFRPAIGRAGSAPPPPPTRLDSIEIPSAWRALIRRCLAREPAARFRNIIEARAALTRPRTGHRRSLLVATFALIVLAAIGVASTKGAWLSAPPPSVVAAPAPAPAPLAASTKTESARSTASASRLAGGGKAKLSAIARRPRKRIATATPAAAGVEIVEPGERGTGTRGASAGDGDDAIDPFMESK